MQAAKILVIDDESPIRRLLDITLRSNGYAVIEAATAKEGLSKIVAHAPDLVILDLGLPDENGRDLLKKMREWCMTPVIILSVVDEEAEMVAALDLGANDYLVKPFRTGELLARIRSALRGSLIENSAPIIRMNGLEVDLSARSVKKDNKWLKLTATQYSLLAIFVKNEGKALTHKYLLREIWGQDYTEELQYLRVFIAQLRKKIERDANYPEHIITESGVGYRFMAGMTDNALQDNMR
jgi:two-component system, OmpR family, KDP operon response regulator KdpE